MGGVTFESAEYLCEEVGEAQFTEVLNRSQKLVKISSRTRYVLGNNTCDLDSMVSALCLAERMREEGGEAVGVLNCDKGDLTSLSYVILFHFLKRKPQPFLFLHQMSQTGLLVLVDHNQLPPHQLYLQERVISVIDHHPPNNTFGGHVTQTIDTQVGSCCTLIFQKIEQPDPTTAMMLAYTIISDTQGLKANLKGTRWWEGDEAALSALSKNIGVASVEFPAWTKDTLHTFLKIRFSSTFPIARDITKLLCSDTKTYIQRDGSKFVYFSLDLDAQKLLQSPNFQNALNTAYEVAEADYAIFLCSRCDPSSATESEDWPVLDKQLIILSKNTGSHRDFSSVEPPGAVAFDFQVTGFETILSIFVKDAQISRKTTQAIIASLMDG